MINFKKISLTCNDKKIFENLSFKIERGGKIIILGESGLGKSSLFHLILGFRKPDEGEVLVDDILVNEKTVWDIRKKISFIDQDVSIGQGKAIDWIHSIFDFKANSNEEFPQKRMEELFEYFQLSPDDLQKNIEDLSGGERQRLAIIAAIILDRKIFLFDEITSALDRQLKGKMVDFFTRNEEWTVIVVSHDSVWLKHPKVKIFNLKEKIWQQ